MSQFNAKLSDFSDPYELLLEMAARAKVDIHDIYLSEITQQYLDLMQQLPEVDLDRASEFVRTASILVYVKSRSLLPKPPANEVDLNVEQEEKAAALLEDLETYKKYKDAAKILKKRETWGDGVFSKLPEEIVGKPGPVEIHGDGALLHQAFLKLLQNRPRKGDQKPTQVQVEVRLETVTIPQQKKRILATLRTNGSTTFEALFEEDSSLEMIVVTFSAMLELWNNGDIEVKQDESFGQIHIDVAESSRATA